jgi:hypothetical protein
MYATFIFSFTELTTAIPPPAQRGPRRQRGFGRGVTFQFGHPLANRNDLQHLARPERELAPTFPR